MVPVGISPHGTYRRGRRLARVSFTPTPGTLETNVAFFPMRILLVSIYYPPEPGANARIVSELAAAWRDAGHQVTVLTDVPHYPDDVVPEAYRRGARRDEQRDGVRVLRCPLWISNRASTVGRLLNNLSFSFSLAWRARLAGPADVIYVYSPPIFLGIGAWLTRLMKRAPIVLNVQDIYPDVVIAHGFLKNRWLIRGFQWFERWVYRRAERIVVISQGFRDNLLAKGAPADRLDVIPNCVDPHQFQPAEKQNAWRAEQGYGPDQFVVLYGGNLGHMQDLSTVVEAARLLERERPKIVFALVGDGVERARLEALIARHRLGNIRLTGACPREAMPGVVAGADACLVMLQSQIAKIWIQSKTYEIMAAGRPIIASIDDDGDNWRLIAEAGAGVHAEPQNPRALATAICRLADDAELCRQLGESGRRHIEQHYTLQRVANQFLDSMRAAIGKPVRQQSADPLPTASRLPITRNLS